MKYIWKILLLVAFTMGMSSCDNDSPTPKKDDGPIAKNVSVTLSADMATGSYLYFSESNKTEGTTSYQWYRADNFKGLNERAIVGENTMYHAYTEADKGKYLCFEVTPKQKDGKVGKTVKSSYAGAVEIADNQKFSNDRVTLYAVSGRNISVIKDYKVTSALLPLQTNRKKHQELWEQILKVVPDSYLSKINQFMIFAGSYNTNSQYNNVLGYVIQTNEYLSKWQFGVAIDYAYQTPFDNHSSGLNSTIVHEFGHILTLNETQLDPTKDAGNCSTYHPGEGCTKANSYLYDLYKKYWTDIPTGNTAEKNYKEYQGRFVSQYAATNPPEDIAETFRHFVLSGTPATNTPTYNEKILDLNAHSELQEIRTYIRTHIGSSSIYSLRKAPLKLGDFRGCGTLKFMHNKHPLAN